MKKILFMQFTVIAVAFLSRPVYAEDTTPPALSYEQHHSEEGPAKDKKESGFIDSKHMKDMMGRRSECLNMHPDGKMCDHQMMEDCQKKMGNGECQKMMKQAKAHKKSKAKEATKK